MENIKHGGSAHAAHVDVETFIPRPSDDPMDPLNWSQYRKYSTLVILCLSGFSGLASATANQLAYLSQASLYHKTPIELSYATSAGFAGLAVGPLIFVPLSYIIGRSACLFWSMVGTLVCAIWSAEMTKENDYIGFVMSRLLGGIFGAVPSTIGASNITDVFFLHERGRAFTYFLLTSLLGTVAGPTFSGFIAFRASWPVEFWWIAGLEGLLILIVLLVFHETGFSRDPEERPRWPVLPRSYVQNRLATFFPGTRTVKAFTLSGVSRQAAMPFVIAICPVTLLAGGFILINFGWAVMISALLSIFLQIPPDQGGYSFSTEQNAAFLFCIWIGLFAAQLYGALFNDRLPSWLYHRNGGDWRPEYRLHSLWIPGLLVLPVGLGVFGATLQYHLHYMVLALATFLVAFAAFLCVPIATNYIVECFPSHVFEASTIMGTYRLVFGLAIPFFIDSWIRRVSVGWVFGMAAFFSLLIFAMILSLMIKGPQIRSWSLSLSKPDGKTAFDAERDTADQLNSPAADSTNKD